MPFDKPKITIDLQEYNHLIGEIKRYEKWNNDEEKIVLKEALYFIFTRTPDGSNLFHLMADVGLNVFIDRMSISEDVYKKIFVKRATK